MGQHELAQLLGDARIVRNGAGVLGIGDDAAPRVHVNAVEPARGKRFGDHAARQPLAVGNDHVLNARRELAHGGKPSQYLIERRELTR